MKSTVIVILFSALSLSGGQWLYGSEIDSVTPRSLSLPESRGAINRIFRERIAEGVAEANRRRGDIEDLEPDEFCDPDLLYTELRKAIFQSFTASWGLKGYNLDKELRELLADRSYALGLNDSIYRDISYLEGFSLNLKELSSVVRISGHLVGLDKIGHMFSEGYHYFAMVEEDGRSLTEAMAWGREEEEGKFGYMTTGILSYGDLVANFHGFRFWNRVLGESRDPLLGFWRSLFTAPYVQCKIQFIDSLKLRHIVRSWEIGAPFDLGEYVDGAWDEAQNCNSYGDPVIEEKVRARISEIDPDFRCPVTPALCQKAQKRYGRWAKYLLHPACLMAGRNR